MGSLKTIGLIMLMGLICQLFGPTVEAQRCIPAGSVCSPNGSMGHCCPGFYCYQQPGRPRANCVLNLS